MNKKLLLLAIILLTSVLSTFAQDACCINPDEGSDYLCKATDPSGNIFTESTCEIGGTGNFISQSCDQIDSCQPACLVCTVGTTQQYFWREFEAEGCPAGFIQDGGPQSLSQSQCTGSPTTIIPPYSASVSGNVKNEINANVDGATVTCTGDITTTDVSGNYILDDCKDIGSTQIFAFYQDKTGKSDAIALSDGAIISGANIKIASAQKAIVTVLVKSTAGAAISGVSVTLTAEGFAETKSTLTAGNAVFTNVPIGYIVVSAEKDAYEPKFAEQQITGDTTVNVELVSAPTAKLSGTITECGTTTPVSNAVIDITKPVGAGQQTVSTKASATNGYYEFTIVKGTYFINAGKSGYADVSEQINLQADTIRNICLSVPTAPAAAYQLIVNTKEQVQTITATTIVEINGALVTLMNSAGDKVSQSTVNGQAVFNVAQGDYSIFVNHADFEPYPSAPETTTVNADTTKDIILTRIPKITIKGTVENAEGGRINSAKIRILGKEYATSNGAFNILHKVSSTAIVVYASAENYITQTLSIPVSQQVPNSDVTLDFVLPSTECTLPIIEEQGFAEFEISKQIVDKKGRVVLTWDAPCSPSGYNIYKDGLLISTVATSENSYVDSGIEEGEVCYRVDAVYPGDGPNSYLFLSSSEECVDFGDAICLQKGADAEFCLANSRVICEDQGLAGYNVEEIENCEQDNNVCMETAGVLGSTRTVCVAQRQCALCNRPFGLFSELLGSNKFFGGQGFLESVSEFPSVDLFECSNSDVPCYRDYSRTVVDKYYDCSSIASCYDYASENSCVGADGNKCLQSQQCEWVDSESYGDELSIGICRPADPLLRDCSEFNSRVANEKFNNVLGVGADICSLYGECYYSGGSCLNTDEVACTDYVTVDDCIGDSPAQEALVNVTWDAQCKKIKGNNFLVPSSDVLSRGVCKWVEGSCIRDADNDTGAVGGVGCGIYEPSGQDCSLDDRDCLTDVVPPVTNLIVPEFVKSITFAYDIIESVSASQVVETFYGFLPSTLTYPTKQASAQSSSIIGSISQDGAYTILFFSKDNANNLEEVKRIGFTLDTTDPVVVLEKLLEPDLANSKVTLTLNLKLTGNDDLAYCVDEAGTGLFEKQGSNLIAITGVAGTEITRTNSLSGTTASTEWFDTYANIETPVGGRNVRYEWKCYDRAGNDVSGHADFVVDADGIINNPQPSAAVQGRTAIPISVDTFYSGNCKYSDVASSFSQMLDKYDDATVWKAFTPDSSGTHHTATVDVSSGEFKTFYVACELNNIVGVIFGSDADHVRITIDDKAPVTKVMRIMGETEEDVTLSDNVWVNGPVIKLVCEDIPQRQDFMPEESGCRTVYSCAGAGCELSEDDVPSITESGAIKFYSEDNLLNKEADKTKSVKFDAVTPELEVADIPFETSRLSFGLTFDIINLGPENCISGPGCDISELVENAEYSIFVGDEQKVSGLIPIPASQLTSSRITFTNLNVPLQMNSTNVFVLTVKDTAGNSVSYSKQIIQDSVGPNLENAEYTRRASADGSSYSTFNIQYGENFILYLNDIADYARKASDSGAIYRVDDVWAEDMFGSVYDLSSAGTGTGVWNKLISTNKWPVTTSDFATYLTIFANDSLGNVAQKILNLSIVDTDPPHASVWFENAYGQPVYELIKGANYIVLVASESLENATLYIEFNNKQYPVVFTARDFDGMQWVGTVNIPDSYTGSSQIKGIIYDRNGLSSSDTTAAFYPSAVDVNAVDLPLAVPSGATLTDGIYVVDSINPSYVLDANYEYQFTVNGKPAELVAGKLTLEPGLNIVEVRMEDSKGNYYLAAHQVTVSIPPQTATSALSILDASSPVSNGNPLKVIFTTSGVPASGQLLVNGLVQSTEITPLGSNLYMFRLNTGLAHGTYPAAEIVLKDATGAEHRQTISITIDKEIANIEQAALTYDQTQVKITDGRMLSKQDQITINGAYSGDAPIIYVIGEDKKRYESSDKQAHSFVVDGARLVGQTFAEINNTLTLVFEDDAGNKAEKRTSIIKDRKPPHLVRLIFART